MRIKKAKKNVDQICKTRLEQVFPFIKDNKETSISSNIIEEAYGIINPSNITFIKDKNSFNFKKKFKRFLKALWFNILV